MKKRNTTSIIITIISILVITIGSAYAFFSADITGSESSSTISVGGGTLTLTVSGGSNISISNIIPGDNEVATKTITLTGTNTTDLTMPYTLSLIIDSNTFATGSIKYTLDSTNTSSNGKIISSISTQTNIATGYSSITLGSGNFVTGVDSVHTYVLKIYFPDSGTDQNSEQGKSISAHIEITAEEALKPPAPNEWYTSASGTLLHALRTNNTIDAPITVPGQAISTSEEAVLASAEDDYGTSYYFRGNVNNNYIKFANMCWRIVRVTGNGSIKLVLYNYNSGSVANPCDVAYDSTTAAFARHTGATYTTAFNTNNTYNAYVGFMYGIVGSASYALEHANTNKSTVMTNLEYWYTAKISSNASKLADTIWCNDKRSDTIYPMATTLGYGTNETGYSANGRIYANNTFEANANPSLICLNDSNGGKLSKFTADETTYGNGALNYKIGLLTIDEIAYAGGRYSKADGSSDNSTYYLYKNATESGWWTMSPCYYNGGSGATIWRVLSTGKLNKYNSWSTAESLRPAVSLISTTTITGLGTSSNPYVVS